MEDKEKNKLFEDLSQSIYNETYCNLPYFRKKIVDKAAYRMISKQYRIEKETIRECAEKLNKLDISALDNKYISLYNVSLIIKKLYHVDVDEV